MTKLVSRLARLSATLVFFIIFLVGLLSQTGESPVSLLPIVLKASVGAFFFWIVVMIVGDIALKGMLETLDLAKDSKWEGGLFTRFMEEKENARKALSDDEDEAEEPGAIATAQPQEKE